MKKVSILFIFLLSVLSKSYGQAHKTSNSYNGQSAIVASGSIKLTDGFHVPEGATFRAYISNAISCSPLALNLNIERNYVAVLQPRIALSYPGPGYDLTTRNLCEVNVSVDYYDGLGRKTQSIQVGGSADAEGDVVQPFVYDIYGRQTKTLLPYISTTKDGSYKANQAVAQAGFYSAPPTSIAATATPFSSLALEASPLGRVLEQGAPGDQWQLASSGINGSGHTSKLNYSVNKTADAPAVILYRADAVTTAGSNHERSLVNGGTYADGELTVLINKDENWSSTDGKAGTVWEYTDKQGHVVLKRSWETGSICLSTYYVYDLMGHLSFVLPPGSVPDGGSIDANALKRFCYQYRYDGRNRLIEKKLPGKGWEYLVYGKRDELVLSQDAKQRVDGIWMFSKYDEKERVLMTGQMSSASSRTTLQTAVTDFTGAAWESYTGSGNYGYSNAAYPTSYGQVLTVNYYDRYNFLNNTFGNPGTGQRTDALGFQTGSLTNVIGSSTMLLSVNYYDDKGRLIQQKSQNHINGTDITELSYNFSNELVASTRTHTVGGSTTTIEDSYTYDHMGRKLNALQSINGATPITISEIVYNELGGIREKKLHNGIQSTSFDYNERCWLKQAFSGQFSYKLKYNDGTAPQFNGNIANQHWGTGNSYPNAFSYGYDKLNRLTTATSTGIIMSEVISYDVMGNIATMNRDGAGVATYSYTGNRLNSINGGGLNATDYGYDENGNATTDGRNGTTMGYNYMNLPSTVNKVGLNLAYLYDATGKKLRKTSGGVIRNYVNGIEYKPDGTIDFITNEVGIARRSTAGTYSYEYTLTDHLGNARYSFDIYNGEVRKIQQQDYYAFGKLRAGQYVNGEKNNYLYNSKELQEEVGQYDYGARFYDPVIGRWNVVDPLAEKMRRYSPYTFVFNNPIRFVDPDGMEGNDFVKRNDGSIYWDNKANDQKSTKSGETYLGKTLKFEFNSYIDGKLWDGPTMGGLIDPAGDKLTSTVTLKASENENGELTGLSASKSVKLGDTPFGEARGYYPGEGGNNNVFSKMATSQGTGINFEQHASVSKSEEMALNSIGYKIVDVAQKLTINYNKSNGNLFVTAFTNIFPSATLKVNGTNVMQYNQPSFTNTHTAPYRSVPYGGRVYDFKYYPTKFYKR